MKVSKKGHTFLHCGIVERGHDGLQKKGHHPLNGRKMRLCKLTNAFFIVACKVFGSLIRQLFPLLSSSLRFAQVSKVFAGRMRPTGRKLPTGCRLPTPAIHNSRGLLV